MNIRDFFFLLLTKLRCSLKDIVYVKMGQFGSTVNDFCLKYLISHCYKSFNL